MESFTQPGDTHTAAAPNPPNRYTSINSQPGQVSCGMVKRSLAMEIPDDDALGRQIMKEDSLNAANTRYSVESHAKFLVSARPYTEDENPDNEVPNPNPR